MSVDNGHTRLEYMCWQCLFTNHG